MDIEEQYDKLYRYCYFKLGNRETAEDITQEAFLRFLESRDYEDRGRSLGYLYTIARNLCIDEYRRPKPEPLEEDLLGSGEEALLERMSIRLALDALDEGERELLLLRYANDVPMAALAELYGVSRFALYRKLNSAARNLKQTLGKEDIP